ncbi:MAG TPA: transglutaminase-like domain-containing protein, partial [Blastocatellia bacterium]|nr:transglutaminase-like domain-containing protein [Blastocatellia bacterium]
VPSWFQIYPEVQVSEFSSWEDVVKFDIPLFQVKQTLPAELTKLIQQWLVNLHTPEDRVLAAVKFVQDEVRYLGIELGSYSHRPNEPAAVFQRRFGDCKDKSLLLCAILRALGVEAYAAVVNTDAQHMLDNWQPSPFAFDHCIVEATLDGRTYWIDPTETQARGRLADRFNPSYERALVVRPGSRELEQIPPPPTNVVTNSIVETYTIDNYNSPVSLEAVTTYRGPYADAIRRSVASQTHADFAKHCLNSYTDTFASIQADGDVTVSDNETDDIVVVTERYRIPGFWEKGSRWLKATHVSEELFKPGVPRRKMPLALSYPLAVSHTIEIHLPERRTINRESNTITDGAIELDYRLEPSDRVIKLDYTLRTLRDNVPPDRVARHIEVLEQINDSTYFELTQGYESRPGTLVTVGVIGAFGAFIIAIGGAVLVVAIVVTKRRREVTRPRPAYPGEAPVSAIPLSSGAALEEHVAKLRCNCGTLYYQPGVPISQQGVTYAGRRVIVVDLKCPRCGRTRDLYFSPQAG